MSVLADRIRPKSLDDFVGQEHLLGENKPLRRIIKSKNIPSMVFYGPCGVGKTTIARIIAQDTNLCFRKLNATIASTTELKEIFSEIDTLCAQNGILLYLDEIQYFNKKQQQTLLEYMENGKITLVASTSENPYFCVYNAVLSRSVVFEFKLVSRKNIEKAVIRALNILNDEISETIEFSNDVVECISSTAGDVRKAINLAELCVLASPTIDNKKVLSVDSIDEILKNNNMRYDKNADEHYDLLSAFQKSMRGSDVDASIHYLARLIKVADLFSICRRLLVCACEDVSLAYPQIIPIVKSCVDSAMQLGFPEARIPLANAVILVASSPKSNSAYLAIDSALRDIDSGIPLSVPRILQNKHCDGVGNDNDNIKYMYPHDYENSYIKQEYMPNELKGATYYKHGNNKIEQGFKSYWDKIKST